MKNVTNLSKKRSLDWALKNQKVKLNPFFVYSFKLWALILICQIKGYSAIINNSNVTGVYNPGSGTHTLISLVVQDGGVATITNSTISVTQGSSFEIEIKKGGKLILSNCTLKVNSISPSYWHGIKVAGKYNAGQYSNYPIDPSYSYSGTSTNLNIGLGGQGYLDMRGCVISDMNDGVFSDYGGILYIATTKFKDNFLSIDIENYINSTSNPNFSTSEHYNACTITECDFEWVANPYHPPFVNASPIESWEYYRFIYLDYVDGVHIQGCNFKNVAANNSTTVSCTHRGTAVQGQEASFSLHKSGTASTNSDGCTEYNGAPCSFEGTSYGVFFMILEISCNIMIEPLWWIIALLINIIQQLI